jgi:hypothetical protein
MFLPSNTMWLLLPIACHLTDSLQNTHHFFPYKYHIIYPPPQYVHSIIHKQETRHSRLSDSYTLPDWHAAILLYSYCNKYFPYYLKIFFSRAGTRIIESLPFSPWIQLCPLRAGKHVKRLPHAQAALLRTFCNVVDNHALSCIVRSHSIGIWYSEKKNLFIYVFD